MEQKTHLLHKLPPMTVCQTNKTKFPKTYLCLVPGEENYTVFTDEGKHFVMTASSKSVSKIVEVKIVHEPNSNFATLASYKYKDDPYYEQLRLEAISYLRTHQKTLHL